MLTPLAQDFVTEREKTGALAIVANAAVSGTTSVDWSRSDVAGSRYQLALAQFRAAIAAHPTARPTAFIMSLGTNDAKSGNEAMDWTGNVTGLLDGLRADLGMDLPCLMEIMPPTIPVVYDPPGWDGWALRRAEQIALPTSEATGVQTPDGPWKDGLHFADAATLVRARNLSAAVPA